MLVERCLRVARAVDDLAARLGRPPTVAELAPASGCTEMQVSPVLRRALGRLRRLHGLDRAQPAPDGTGAAG